MQSFLSGDARINFKAENFDEQRQTLVFVNSLGTDFRIWQDVERNLGTTFNIVLHDKRGHGLSTLGAAPHRIETYAQDLANLLDYIGAKTATAIGLSVGGMIVQALYHERPDLVSRLVISNSAVKIGTAQSWNQRISAVENAGIESLADAIMKMWFSPQFHQKSASELSIYRTMLARTYAPGYIACCEALRDADFTGLAKDIKVPTLFIAGEHDGSTPVALVENSSRMVKGRAFKIIPGAAHIPCVEMPEEYVCLVRNFAIGID